MDLHFLLADEDGRRMAELERTLRKLGARTSSTRSGLAEAVTRERPDACFVDALLPGLPETLSELQRSGSSLPIVVVASQDRQAEALEAVRRGAADLLSRPVEPAGVEAALLRLERIRGHRRLLAREREALRRRSATLWLGDSAAGQQLRKTIERVAGTPRTTVLVAGAPGTDKARVAMALHERSARNDGAFVRIDCRHDRDVEAVLLGTAGRPSAIADAAGGTLLIEGVDGLATGLQERFAALLSERGSQLSGKGPGRELDARIVATTAEDLDRAVEEGRFREDLLYRLNVLTIEIPPLAERREDVPVLALHHHRELAPRGASRIGEEALAALARTDWPGNDRELRGVVERALLVRGEREIRPEDLAPLAPFASFSRGGGSAPGSSSGDELPIGDRSMKAVEEALIRRVLEEEGGNRSRVARVLGINRTTLYNKLRLYGID